MPPPSEPIPPAAQRARDANSPRSLYELAIRLMQVLQTAHPSSRFGVAVSRHRSLADLFHAPVTAGGRTVLHLVIEDDPSLLYISGTGELTHIAHEFKQDASPTGWDAIEYIYAPTSTELRNQLRAIEEHVDLTVSSLHTNAFGDRTVVWDVHGESGRPPDMASAEVLMYHPQHHRLVRA